MPFINQQHQIMQIKHIYFDFVFFNYTLFSFVLFFQGSDGAHQTIIADESDVVPDKSVIRNIAIDENAVWQKLESRATKEDYKYLFKFKLILITRLRVYVHLYMKFISY